MIFVSYSTRDSRFAHLLVDELERGGAEVWIDYRKLFREEDIVGQLCNAIDACQVVVFLDSANSKASDWVNLERRLADEKNKFQLSLKIEGGLRGFRQFSNSIPHVLALIESPGGLLLRSIAEGKLR